MPPSRLGTFGRKYLDPNTIGSRSKLAQQQAQRIPIGPPFGGYCPDLAKTLLDWRDATAMTALIERSGILEIADGYSRIDNARLPLGDDSPPAATGRPITGIFQSLNTATKDPVRIALTSGPDVTPPITDGGRVYVWSFSTSQWEHKAYSGAGNALTGDATNPEKILFDATFFGTATGGWCVFTNNVDEIMRYPDGAGTGYVEFDTSGDYIAKSVESSEDRILALNVSVGGTRKLTRLIWTNKAAAPSFSTANAGAGDADFDEVKGQGLRVMNLGRLVALYFDTAVVLLSRTGILVDPFRRFYSSHDRGLLSTHSVVNLGSGLHFGLFSDGWFFLDESGQWREAGLRARDGVSFHKWHRTFYELLDWQNRDRVVCGYDPVNRHIKIAFPSKGNSSPDQVWCYDLMGDRLWVDNTYGTNTPNCWGLFQEEAVTGEAWSAITSTWASEGRTWDSLESTRGRIRVIHGTTDGLVFLHSPNLVTRDSTLPTYSYTSPQLGTSDSIQNARKLIVSYKRKLSTVGGDPPPVNATLSANSGQSQTSSLQQDEGELGTNQSAFVSGVVAGSEVGWAISGTAPLSVQGLELHVTVRPDVPIRVPEE